MDCEMVRGICGWFFRYVLCTSAANARGYESSREWLGTQVGVGLKDRSALAQVCIVNSNEEIVYLTYVQTKEQVAGACLVSSPVSRGAAPPVLYPCRLSAQ